MRDRMGLERDHWFCRLSNKIFFKRISRMLQKVSLHSATLCFMRVMRGKSFAFVELFMEKDTMRSIEIAHCVTTPTSTTSQNVRYVAGE